MRVGDGIPHLRGLALPRKVDAVRALPPELAVLSAVLPAASTAGEVGSRCAAAVATAAAYGLQK